MAGRFCFRLGVLTWAVLSLGGLSAFGSGRQASGTVQSQKSLPVGGTTGALLDINTATVADLRALPGMGDAYVRRIVEGRPYTAKNQLVTRGVLPAAAYEAIRDRIVAHRPVTVR